MPTVSRKLQSLNVLFIGNSFTSRNDLPGLIAQLASARSHTLRHKLIFAGGAPLRAHWNAGLAGEEIRNGKYDFVVLQEQSTLPAKNAVRFHENVRLFDEVIRSAGSRLALYMTWARRKTPETQAAIADAYRSIGQELDAMVIPVGTAWEKVLAQPNPPVLHAKDNSHPSLAGSYLAACVFYGSLFGETPVGIEDGLAGMCDIERSLLQQAACEVFRSASKRKMSGRGKPVRNGSEAS